MASGNPDTGAFPHNPAEAEVWHERSPVRFSSPHSGRDQVVRRFGKWRLSYTWELLDDDDFNTIFPIFGRYGTETPFTLYDIRRPLPTGDATVAQLATLKVVGAGQTGQSLAVDGGPNSTLIFAAGDLIGLANTGQVLQVRANCTTNGSGAATILLQQYIGKSPADNEDVIVSYVPIRVLLDRDPHDRVTPPMRHSFTVEATETF